MAEYTQIYCSREVAIQLDNYLDEQMRGDENAPDIRKVEVDDHSITITYEHDDEPQRQVVDAMLMGFRDGWIAREEQS